MIKEFASQLGLENSTMLIEEVETRLREHRFTVAVVGEFKTGKSTFAASVLPEKAWTVDLLRHDQFLAYSKDPSQFRREARSARAAA